METTVLSTMSEPEFDVPAPRTRKVWRARRYARYARLDALYKLEPKATIRRQAEAADCPTWVVAEWRLARKVTTRKLPSPKGSGGGYHTRCPCGIWFWTQWKRRPYHSLECYRSRRETPIHDFLRKLGNSYDLSLASGASDRAVRIWYVRGIPVNRVSWFVRYAQEKGVETTVSEIAALNGRTKQLVRIRGGRKEKGPIALESVLIEENVARVDEPVLEITVYPQEHEMAMLIEMLRGPRAIVSPPMAQHMMMRRWVERRGDNLWHITGLGRLAVKEGSVREYVVEYHEAMQRQGRRFKDGKWV